MVQVHTYIIDARKNCVYIKGYGELGLKDIETISEDYLNDSDFKKNMNTIWDCRKAIFKINIPGDVTGFYDLLKNASEFRETKYKVAMVVNKKQDISVIISAIDVISGFFGLKFFYSLKLAEEWINK